MKGLPCVGLGITIGGQQNMKKSFEQNCPVSHTRKKKERLLVGDNGHRVAGTDWCQGWRIVCIKHRVPGQRRCLVCVHRALPNAKKTGGSLLAFLLAEKHEITSQHYTNVGPRSSSLRIRGVRI